VSEQNAAIFNILPSGRARSNDWTLTQAAFDKLLSNLDPNYERAAEKYVTFYSKLLKFFEWRGCVVPDLYVDETINRVTRKIEQGTLVDNFQGFLYGVAKNVLREALKQDNEVKTSIDDGTFGHIPQPEEVEPDYRLECIEVCLLQLPTAGRELLLAYYETGPSLLRQRRELARRQGVSLVTLRVQVHRLRRTLEQYVTECVTHHREDLSGRVIHTHAGQPQGSLSVLLTHRRVYARRKMTTGRRTIKVNRAIRPAAKCA